MSAQTLPETGDPSAFVDLLVERHDEAFVSQVTEELLRRDVGSDLTRVMQLWQLSQTDLGNLFGVSRQAVAKWVAGGVPADRIEPVTDLVRITDLLAHYLQPDRIPAVVRRRAPALDDDSLLGLVGAGRTTEALRMTRAMFAFGERHG